MAEPAYKVKQVSFKGRRVPIMLQDVNGPCPLLAIANVLLLRNQLQLPANIGEVSQDRLVQMVAGRLLDANSLERQPGAGSTGAAGLTEEQRASLAQNLGDAIALLPKLTTGIDVNLRFHDIKGFEYTPEVAVFDLLDIQLVHGWLVDPQDEATARAVGTKSYNELVVQLVTALGSAATPKQLTPTASLRGQTSADMLSTAAAAAGAGATSSLSPRGSSSGAGALAAGPGQQAAHQPQPAVQPAAAAAGGQQPVDAEALSAALRQTLHISVPPHQQQQEGGSGAASGAGLQESSRAQSNASMQTTDSMHSMVNRMLTDLVSDAFAASPLATPGASRSTGHAAQNDAFSGDGSAGGVTGGGSGSGPDAVGEQEATSQLRAAGGVSSGTGDSLAATAAAATGAGAELATAAQLGGSGRIVKLNLTVDDGAGATARPVRVQLAMIQQERQEGEQQALLPSLPASSSGLAVQRSTPATPHPSAASMLLLDDLPVAAAGASVALAAAAGPEGPPSPAAATPSPSAAAVEQLPPPPAESQTPEATPSPGPAAQTSPGGPATTSGGGGPGSGAGSPGEAAVREALLVQQFLEGHPSQLTFHGLLALHEGLRPNQLAVFFRNNHFNTLFKAPDGQLYILVTDEGFQFESDVVWEQLISVDGDTQLVNADLRPFQPHASQQEAAARQAAAQDAEWQAAAAAAAAAGGASHDADLALAMQLQAEEEERVRLEQQRRQQMLARQQEEQRRQQQATAQQQGRVLPSQRRPSSASSSSSGGGGKKKKKSSTDSCSIM